MSCRRRAARKKIGVREMGGLHRVFQSPRYVLLADYLLKDAWPPLARYYLI